MKKHFIAAAISAVLLLTSTSLLAQDSTSVSKPRILPDFDLPILDKVMNKHKDGIDLGNFGFGPIFNDSSAPYDFNKFSSYEIFLFDAETIASSNVLSLSFGFGLDWKNFKLTGNEALSKAQDSSIILGPYPEGSSPKLSKVTVFSLSFPILASVNICNGFGFSFGPVLNLNAGSRIKTKYKIGDEKFKDVYKDAHCNLFSADLMGEINLKSVSIYVKYSPMSVMDKAYWPEFQHFSFGIAL